MNKADLRDQHESIREVDLLDANRTFELTSVRSALLVGFIGKVTAASRLVSDNRIHTAILLDRLFKSTPIYRSAQ